MPKVKVPRYTLPEGIFGGETFKQWTNERGQFTKGNPGPGRSRAGCESRIALDVREMVLGALEEAGGVDYLREQAHANPVAFLSLVSKCMPREIKASVNVTSLEALVVRSYEREAELAEQQAKAALQ